MIKTLISTFNPVVKAEPVTVRPSTEEMAAILFQQMKEEGMMDDMFQTVSEIAFEEAMQATYEAGLSDDSEYEMDVVYEIQILIAEALKDMMPSA